MGIVSFTYWRSEPFAIFADGDYAVVAPVILTTTDAARLATGMSLTAKNAAPPVAPRDY